MRHENTLDQGRAALLIVDMQEAFRASVSDFAETAARIALVTHAAALLDVPMIVTEQYPKGLGRTAAEISAVLPAAARPIEKMSFSCAGAPDFLTKLEETGRRQILVCGIEAHICVNQTTHDLLALGLQVHPLTDCITARQESNKTIALAKMQASGALLSTTEMALFELMRDAGHTQFRTIQRLIK